VVVQLRGDVDISTESEVVAKLDRAIDSGATTVVVDLRELDFIDVVGTHALEAARRRCVEEGTRFFLVHGPWRVRRVLSLCGVDEFDSLADPADLQLL
jgi:anti-anti-sigma factor